MVLVAATYGAPPLSGQWATSAHLLAEAGVEVLLADLLDGPLDALAVAARAQQRLAVAAQLDALAGALGVAVDHHQRLVLLPEHERAVVAARDQLARGQERRVVHVLALGDVAVGAVLLREHGLAALDERPEAEVLA